MIIDKAFESMFNKMKTMRIKELKELGQEEEEIAKISIVSDTETAIKIAQTFSDLKYKNFNVYILCLNKVFELLLTGMEKEQVLELDPKNILKRYSKLLEDRNRIVDQSTSLANAIKEIEKEKKN